MTELASQIRAASEASCERTLAIVEQAQQIMRTLHEHRHAHRHAASLRATAAPNFTPPDPYALDIAKQRARDDAKHPPLTIAPPLEVHNDEGGIPDPYFNDLQTLRSKR